jgi:hypothetical protein
VYGNESDLHVLTLLDQVMYLVVYGNRTDLDERIPPAERDGFFEGLVSSASDLRANYARSWKARRRIQKTRRQSGPLRCLSRFNRSDDEDEDGEVAGSVAGSGNEGEVAGSGNEGEVQNTKAGGEDGSDGEEQNQFGIHEDEEVLAAKQKKGD